MNFKIQTVLLFLKKYIYILFISVHETTSDIVCVVCKEDKVEADDDIVLCDSCSVGMIELLNYVFPTFLNIIHE